MFWCLNNEYPDLPGRPLRISLHMNQLLFEIQIHLINFLFLKTLTLYTTAYEDRRD